MSFFKTMSCPLQALSLPVRLTLIASCFLLCCLIVLVSDGLLHTSNAAALFVLPVCLASWCFKQRGAFLSVAGLLLFLAVLNTREAGSLWWPRATLWGFLFGAVGFTALGVLVALLKRALDLSHLARAKAQQAEERLQQLQLLRNQFLVNVTHELRTPLTQLRGYLELLKEYRGQLDAPTQALFLHSALAGCDELQLLVDNVLDAAQTTSEMKPPRCEVLHVAEVFQDVLAHVDPATREAYRVHVECEAELSLWADAQYTRQVLRNLLSNAFKYSPTHTTVVLSVSLCEGEDAGSSRMTRLCVKDEGPGIPPDEAPLLFEHFVRLPRDLAGPVQGTGLGLSISKQLVEAMGGRIWIESAGVAGQGSRFCFTLPQAGKAGP